MELIPEHQEKKIKGCLEDFFSKNPSFFPRYLKSKEFEEHKGEALDHIRFFQEELPSRVDELSEFDLEEILSNIWAINYWSNLQYRARKIIEDNRVENVRLAFKVLLDTSKDPEERYWEVLKKIKGLGPAIITEILAYVHPHECAIWNRRAREALDILGINLVDNLVDTKKWEISAKEYKVYNQVVKLINKKLSQFKKAEDDVGLLFVDFFFYEISKGAPPEPTTDFDDILAKLSEEEERAPPEPTTDFDHDEIRDLTRDIGAMLGFEADTEVQVARGARVDVVWSAKIGNLGIVNYVFEVHRSGSIDSLLMNLQKAKNSPTVQKVVAISDKVQLEKIREESGGLPEEFRRDLTFWPVEEVLKVAGYLESAMRIIDGLNLTPEPFK